MNQMERIRQLVVDNCEKRGAALVSRQAEAIVEVFSALLKAVCEEMGKLEERVDLLELDMSAAGVLS